MVPFDIATAAHNTVCGSESGHEAEAHLLTSTYYANYLTERGLNVTGQEFINALLAVAWPDRSLPWPGHPHPDLIIDYFKGQPT
jgi:hypothetical protein